MKNVTTFVYPIPASGRYRSIIAVFLCLIDFIDTVEARCRSSRNCLNTIALAGLDNGNDGTVFCRLKQISNNAKMKNNTIKLPSKNDGKLPEALQSAISEFFTYNGTPSDIESTQWEMLESATAGVEEIGLSASEVLNFMFLYKTSKELFQILHSFHSTNTIELCKN
jgi:hypothetical protein